MYIINQDGFEYFPISKQDFSKLQVSQSVMASSLIQAYQNCPIDFKLGMIIPETVRCNEESVVTL